MNKRHRVYIYLTVGFIIGLIIVLGVYKKMTKSPDEICGAMYFILDENDKNKYINAANNGDNEAAYKLFQHYATGVPEKNSEHWVKYWLKKAAALGNKNAKKIIDNSMEDSKENGENRTDISGVTSTLHEDTSMTNTSSDLIKIIDADVKSK